MVGGRRAKDDCWDDIVVDGVHGHRLCRAAGNGGRVGGTSGGPLRAVCGAGGDVVGRECAPMVAVANSAVAARKLGSADDVDSVVGLDGRLVGGRLSPGELNRKRPTHVRRFLKKAPWQRPTLPGGLPPSTIGAGDLNFRVREGTGCTFAAQITKRRFNDVEAKYSREKYVNARTPSSPHHVG